MLPRARPSRCCEITDDKFIDDGYDVFVGDGAIVLTNWGDGHNHLYLYSYDQGNPAHATANLERQLTKGDFEVGDVFSVDSVGKRVEYASNEGNVLEQQLWQVGFNGERKQMTSGAGSMLATLRPRAARLWTGNRRAWSRRL